MPTVIAPGLTVRGFTPPLQLSRFGLIAFDMDSTLIGIECIDEIAAAAGRKAEVAAITAAAMRGEIAVDLSGPLLRRAKAGEPMAALRSKLTKRYLFASIHRVHRGLAQKESS